MSAPGESGLVDRVILDVTPDFRCTKNGSERCPHVFDRAPGKALLEFVGQESLDTFPRNQTQLDIAKRRKNVNFDDVFVMLLSCILQCGKCLGFPFLDKITKQTTRAGV